MSPKKREALDQQEWTGLRFVDAERFEAAASALTWALDCWGPALPSEVVDEFEHVLREIGRSGTVG